jgi:hypothetical protein
MTAARQPRKFGWGLALGSTPALALGLVLIGVGLILPPMVRPAAEPVEVNTQTGLAISGFDPVVYFTDGKPGLGRAGLELNFGGAVWQFRNEGNRAAFAKHPEVYMPRFGGYDPVAVARGITVPGHPLIWALVGQRLYLFYDAKARATFLTDPGRIIVAAERKWPALAKGLGH